MGTLGSLKFLRNLSTLRTLGLDMAHFCFAAFLSCSSCGVWVTLHYDSPHRPPHGGVQDNKFQTSRTVFFSSR